MRFSSCRNRLEISVKYVRGSGIEIGPLHSAWPVSTSEKVLYLDRFTKEELVKQYPELNAEDIAQVDLIDDGRYLKTIEDDSQDFILNSHVLEHCDNPLRTLDRWLEVLRVGGFVVGSVPNKDHTFDRDRPVTLFRELEGAYRGDPNWKYTALKSFHQHVDKLEGVALEDAIVNSIVKDMHVHFPVWNFEAFSYFLGQAPLVIKHLFTIEELKPNGGGEILFVLRKTA